MKSTEARDWGIWYTGTAYRVAHFLKTLGPESKVRRFNTKQAAEAAVMGSRAGGRYEVRLIPTVKQTPVKN